MFGQGSATLVSNRPRTAPTEFITTKVLAKYRGPIVDTVDFNGFRHKYRELQQLKDGCLLGSSFHRPDGGGSTDL
jgi:hypothetical protein